MKSVLNFPFFKKYQKSPEATAQLNREVLPLLGIDDLKKKIKNHEEQQRKARLAEISQSLHTPLAPIKIPRFKAEDLMSKRDKEMMDKLNALMPFKLPSDSESDNEETSSTSSHESSSHNTPRSSSDSEDETHTNEPSEERSFMGEAAKSMFQLPAMRETAEKLEKTDLSTLSGPERAQAEVLLELYNESKKVKKTVPSFEEILKDVPEKSKAKGLLSLFVNASSVQDLSKKWDKMDLSHLCKSDLAFVDLPVELLFYIFSHLGGVQLQAVARVCRKFKEIAYTLEGFQHVFKARSLQISPFQNYKHLCLTHSILNLQCHQNNWAIKETQPLLAAKFCEGYLIDIDKQGKISRRVVKIEKTSISYQKMIYPFTLNNPLIEASDKRCVLSCIGGYDFYLISDVNTTQTLLCTAPNLIHSLSLFGTNLAMGFDNGSFAIFENVGAQMDFPTILNACLGEPVASVKDEVVSIQFFSGGKQLLSVTKSGVCKIWNTADFKVEKVYQSSPLDRAKVLGNKWLLQMETTGLCTLVNMKEDKKLSLKYDSPTIASTRLWETLFIAYKNKKILAWDMNSGAKLKEFLVAFDILDIQFKNNTLWVIGNGQEVQLISYHFDLLPAQRSIEIDDVNGTVNVPGFPSVIK
ncbi:MAG: F-box protein [Verrucomicrobia bacterium]|nr:F-box protein [Verrucomicrobiota bacterium]